MLTIIQSPEVNKKLVTDVNWFFWLRPLFEKKIPSSLLQKIQKEKPIQRSKYERALRAEKLTLKIGKTDDKE